MKIFGVRVPFTSSSPERRSTAPIPDDRWMSSTPYVYLGGETPITPETALRFSAVFGCVRVISQTLAALPLLMYERQADGGKNRATKHPLYTLLRTKPNRFKTSGLEFREQLTAHALLHGNGYAQIIKNGRDEPLELIPMHPSRVRPDVTKDEQMIYRVAMKGGGERILPADDVFHIRAFRDSGLEGVSPIAMAEKIVRSGLSLESFGMNFFEGGAFPAGVLEYPGEMSAEAKTNLAESWHKLYGGENRGKKAAVLEAGLKWSPMGIPQSDAQFLEQRKFQVTEICRIYGVPPHLLADLDRATFSNIEEQNQNFVDYCLMPWFKRWEEAIVRDFLDGDDSKYFAEFLADGLLRGNTAARTSSYAMGRQWGWFSINDIRSRENLNPIGPEGDVYLSPMNMVPAGEEGQQPDPAQDPESDGKSEEESPKIAKNSKTPAENREKETVLGGETSIKQPKNEPKSDDNRLNDAFRGAFRETWQRVIRKEIGAVKKAARAKNSDFDAWMDEFVVDQQCFASECLGELARTLYVLRGLDSSLVLPELMDHYRASIRDRVDAWRADPASGYDHHEDELASYWTERMLNYSVSEYEHAA